MKAHHAPAISTPRALRWQQVVRHGAGCALLYGCSVAWAGNMAPPPGTPKAAARVSSPSASQTHSTTSGTGEAAAGSVRPTPDIAARLAAADCKGLNLEAAPLVALQQILQPLGLGVRILGCPQAPAPLNQRVLALTAVVVDGDKATDTVRGALGDGEWVDMGGDYHPQPWPDRSRVADREVLDDGEVSPDVQFNRRWLRSVMASQGFASVTGPWWAFIPVKSHPRGSAKKP